MTVKAVVGCALNDGDGYSLICGPLASPLTFKLVGKIPDGLKFDAKKGLLSGVPKKPGKTSATITATDPAKHTKSLTVNFDVSPLPEWLVGEFRGSCSEFGTWEWDSEAHADRYVAGRPNGLLELSVKSDGKVSAKVINRLGSSSLSGTLTWRPGEGDDADGSFSFLMSKSGLGCNVNFLSGGTIDGTVWSYTKTADMVGEIQGMRQDTTRLVDSPFLDKYYTFAFSAMTTQDYDDESQVQSGYGYLTIKTDKKGTAKVVGQLPDGEKVSMSALVLPFEEENETKARLYVFASPSSYKKLDWFAMALTILPDGSIEAGDGAVWTPAESTVYDDYYGYETTVKATLTGEGSLYSEAKTLEGYYWTASCAWSDRVRQQVTHKEGKWTYYDEDAYALEFDGFFNVSVQGDKKGAISLVEKSPAPWVVNKSYWNCWEDKKGNPITDPSQLSISFTKATGIFTGKASVYFDYPLLKAVTLPYAGVMIYDGEDGYRGLGSAVYTYKYTDIYYSGKTEARTVTLPVSLDPAQ